MQYIPVFVICDCTPCSHPSPEISQVTLQVVCCMTCCCLLFVALTCHLGACHKGRLGERILCQACPPQKPMPLETCIRVQNGSNSRIPDITSLHKAALITRKSQGPGRNPTHGPYICHSRLALACHSSVGMSELMFMLHQRQACCAQKMSIGRPGLLSLMASSS